MKVYVKNVLHTLFYITLLVLSVGILTQLLQEDVSKDTNIVQIDELDSNSDHNADNYSNAIFSKIKYVELKNLECKAHLDNVSVKVLSRFAPNKNYSFKMPDKSNTFNILLLGDFKCNYMDLPKYITKTKNKIVIYNDKEQDEPILLNKSIGIMCSNIKPRAPDIKYNDSS